MILDEVKKAIQRYNLTNKGDKVVVGVSGGPDSVALLYLLNKLKKELKLSLHIAHLDHRLRRDSYKDREFVEKLARKLKIPVTVAKINIKELEGAIKEFLQKDEVSVIICRRICALIAKKQKPDVDLIS